MDPNKPCLGILFEIEKLEEIDCTLYGKVAWGIILNAIDVEGMNGSIDFFEGDTQATVSGQEYVYCIALQTSNKSVITAFQQALDASQDFLRCIHAPGFIAGTQVYSEPLIHSAHVTGGQVDVKSGSPLRYALAAAKKAQREARLDVTTRVPERTRPASSRVARLPEIRSLDALKSYLEQTFPKNSYGFWFFLTPEELCDVAEATHGVLRFYWDEPEHGGMSGDEVEVTATEAFEYNDEDESPVPTLRFNGLAAFASDADAVGWCRENELAPALWGVEGKVATKLMGQEGNSIDFWVKEEFRDREVTPSELWERFCRRRQAIGCSVETGTSPQTKVDNAPPPNPTDNTNTQPPIAAPSCGRMIARGGGEIKFACPTCDQHILIEERAAGLSVECPGCRETMIVPSEHPQTEPEPDNEAVSGASPPPLPPPLTQRKTGRRTPPNNSITFQDGRSKMAVTLRREGEGCSAELADTSGFVVETIHFPSLRLGILGAYRVGSGRLLLTDAHRRKHTFEFSSQGDNDRVFEWLGSAPPPMLQELLDRFEGELDAIEEAGVSLEHMAVGLEIDEKVEKPAELLVVFTDSELVIFRTSEAHHPLFSRAMARFPFPQVEISRGFESVATGMGYRMGQMMGGAGGLDACRVKARGGATFMFQAAKDFVSDIVTASRSCAASPCAGKQAETAAIETMECRSCNGPIQVPKPESAPPRILDDTPLDYSKIVYEAVREYLPATDIYLATGRIPPKKEQNARKSCCVPPEIPILVLINCTVLGSAKNCLLFTPEAFYCHNGWSGNTPGTIRIPYSEFPSRHFGDGGFLEVHLDHNQCLNVSGCGISKANILAMLCNIKMRIAGTKPLPEAGRQKELSHTIRGRQATLVCPLCRTTYKVGQDACIISLGNVFAFMAGQGTAIIGNADGMAASTPDLVGRIIASWSKAEREERLEETQANVERVRAMIQSGQHPQWECHACQGEEHPNPYPKDF